MALACHLRRVLAFSLPPPDPRPPRPPACTQAAEALHDEALAYRPSFLDGYLGKSSLVQLRAKMAANYLPEPVRCAPLLLSGCCLCVSLSLSLSGCSLSVAALSPSLPPPQSTHPTTADPQAAR